jgi:hypothetical protein
VHAVAFWKKKCRSCNGYSSLIRRARYVGRIICAHAEKDIDFVEMNKRLGFFAHGLEHFDDLGGPIRLLDKISDAGPIHLGFRFRINIATADNNL